MPRVMNKRNVPMTVHVTEDFQQELQTLANKERRSLSSLMYTVLQDFMKRKRPHVKRRAA